MNDKKQIFIVLTIFIMCISLSCQKEKLPKATEKGKNTFGCKIDGKVFVPKYEPTFPNVIGLRSFYDESNGYMELSASEPSDREHNGFQRHISFYIKNLQLGANPLNETNTAEVDIYQTDQAAQFYQTNATTGGTLTVTRLDTIANIISGMFSFQAALRPDNSKTVSVTNGRFDITYKP